MTDVSRKANRISVSRPVIILLDSGKKVHAYIIEIGVSGFVILTTMPAEINAKMRFKFSVPIGKLMREFVVRGKIVHSRLRADKYLSAIDLVDCTEDDSKALKKFIAEVRSKRT